MDAQRSELNASECERNLIEASCEPIANEAIKFIASTYGVHSLFLPGLSVHRVRMCSQFWCKGFRSNNTSLLDEGFIPQYAGTLQNPRGSTPFVLRYIGGIVGIMHVAIVPLPKTFFIFIGDNIIRSQKVTEGPKGMVWADATKGVLKPIFVGLDEIRTFVRNPVAQFVLVDPLRGF